jgi:hypothetical protein
MEDGMEIKITEEQGRVPVTIFHLDGDLAADSYELLQARARQAIADGTCYLLLDMEKVSYMSSAGIRAIYQIFSWLRELPDGEDEAALKAGLLDGLYKSRRLKLLDVSKRVKESMATAGLDMYLEIHHDLKKALASF